ncbi:hypothetical protein ACOMHN_066546 [Nucella lapillus]
MPPTRCAADPLCRRPAVPPTRYAADPLCRRPAVLLSRFIPFLGAHMTEIGGSCADSAEGSAAQLWLTGAAPSM